MSLADLSIKRPTFITCIVLVMLVVGYLCMKSIGVDLFPDVTFPVVVVNTEYPGAGPAEIETLISKRLEDEMSSIAGVKRLSSVNYEGLSQMITEFTLETDIKYAEQQIRDRVSSAKSKLPKDIKEPVIRRIDPSDQPILILALDASLPTSKLYDVANETIRPRLEQINQVGLVEIMGGRKREIRVALDRQQLKNRELSVAGISDRLTGSGENVPSGKYTKGAQDLVFRTLGEFKSIQDIEKATISFFGNDVPTTISQVGKVIDTVEDERSRAYVNGKKSLFIRVFRQTGANTVAVVDGLKKRIDILNKELGGLEGKPQLTLVRDSSVWIRANVEDVQESIFIGIFLAVVVVYFFLGNGRSTIITGLALPNSIIGAFILMALAGFTINIMTLLALSLSVGLLIDDAIVVRENIFRHIENGESPVVAARNGTLEVQLAVIATTLTVISVFGPMGYLKGVTGQFFKQFGLTICFAMAISLFDALTIAPMLSAYFAGRSHFGAKKTSLWGKTVGRLVVKFDGFQRWLENGYEKLLHITLRHPLKLLLLSVAIFFVSSYSVKYIPKTFLPAQDAGEFLVSLDMPPGTSLEKMDEISQKVDQVIRSNSEVAVTALTVGGRTGQTEVSETYVRLVPARQRKMNTSEVKQKLRDQLVSVAFANPQVKDYDALGFGQRAFNLSIVGFDEKQLEDVAEKTFQVVRKYPGLKDVETTYKPGKPEFQIKLDPLKAKTLGISDKLVGYELRAQIEGLTPSVFREMGREYDVRVRLEDDQRNLKAGFHETYVPNLNQRLIRLKDVAVPRETTGPATIRRQDRGRVITISGDIAPGAGLGDIMEQVRQLFNSDIPLPPGMNYRFLGQAESYEELGSSMSLAVCLGVLLIYLVLSSLYESFVIPFTIMLALPLAVCGSFVALLICRETLNIFSMIGTIMLLGIATKNSILLVDYAHQLIEKGVDRAEALVIAGKTRLRPILMTTMALIAGTIPVAMGLNEASRQRTSMGVAIIGGLISSTLLSLIVIPAAFSFIDRFRLWSKAKMKRLFQAEAAPEQTVGH